MRNFVFGRFKEAVVMRSILATGSSPDAERVRCRNLIPSIAPITSIRMTVRQAC